MAAAGSHTPLREVEISPTPFFVRLIFACLPCAKHGFRPGQTPLIKAIVTVISTFGYRKKQRYSRSVRVIATLFYTLFKVEVTFSLKPEFRDFYSIR